MVVHEIDESLRKILNPMPTFNLHTIYIVYTIPSQPICSGAQAARDAQGSASSVEDQVLVLQTLSQAQLANGSPKQAQNVRPDRGRRPTTRGRFGFLCVFSGGGSCGALEPVSVAKI